MANILYIDDIIEKMPSFGSRFSNAVKSLGHSPFTAVNGLEGLKIVKSTHVDLICLDWDMPVMNGYGFLQNLQSGGYQIPVVICSTYAASDTGRERLEAAVKDTKYEHVVGYSAYKPEIVEDISGFLALLTK